jgi:hypothetical protein
VAADTAAALAAREAASGAWLAELEGGKMSRVVAPGLPRGIFGAWAQPELPDGASGHIFFRGSGHGAQRMQASPGGSCGDVAAGVAREALTVLPLLL